MKALKEKIESAKGEGYKASEQKLIYAGKILGKESPTLDFDCHKIEIYTLQSTMIPCPSTILTRRSSL